MKGGCNSGAGPIEDGGNEDGWAIFEGMLTSPPLSAVASTLGSELRWDGGAEVLSVISVSAAFCVGAWIVSSSRDHLTS